VTATIEPLTTNDQCVAAASLLARVWGTSIQSAPISSDLVRSLVHSGACALGAVDDGQVVGVAIGVFGPPRAASLYSLIAAVDRSHAARGIGRALKQHQRQWAVERGATSMIWTFDPLVRRNAHFNLNCLGAEVVEFSESFYPPMHDTVNRDDLSDRLTARWNLVGAAKRAGDAAVGRVVLEQDPAGRPRRVASATDDPVLLAGLPEDIETLRHRSPAVAADWRLALRDVLRMAFQSGYRISGLDDGGHYVLQRAGG
jgi:predicted GNAT superfamily acetyltransferase